MTSLYGHDIFFCFILADYQTELWEKYLVTGDWSQSIWTPEDFSFSIGLVNMVIWDDSYILYMHQPKRIQQRRYLKWHTVDSRYLEIQGTLWNISRYPYSDLRNWGKQLIQQPTLTEWIFNLTPKLEIYWTYCEKEEKLLLRSNFSSFPQYFVACW